MSDSVKVRSRKIHAKFREQFKVFRSLVNPHLDLITLTRDGIDVSNIDLYQETEVGGLYFHPMSQSRLDSLDERPDFHVLFSMDDPVWNYSDGLVLTSALWAQLRYSRNEDLFQAIKTTKWRNKVTLSSTESILQEQGGGNSPEPTRQYDWDLISIFTTKSLPHQICMSAHAIPNVQGPLRSELMIIIGVMGARMRITRFKDQETFPFTMVSAIGRTARIIQAHVCPRDQRLKLRYSQLVDFSTDASAKKDIFLRWLMSEPITPPKPMADEGDQLEAGPVGDTAPQNSVHKTTNTAPILTSRHCQLSPESSIPISPGAIVSVA